MKTTTSKTYETAKAALAGARTSQRGSDHYYRGGGFAGCDLCYVADGRGGATRIDIGPDGEHLREVRIPAKAK